MQKNHKLWKEEAVRHSKDLELQLEKLTSQRAALEKDKIASLQAAHAERDSALAQVAELNTHLHRYKHPMFPAYSGFHLSCYLCCRLEEEGVRRSGEGHGEIIMLKNEVEVGLLNHLDAFSSSLVIVLFVCVCVCPGKVPADCCADQRKG